MVQGETKPEVTQIKINDKWVDLTKWKKIHPGGAAPLERYHNQDATDAFTSLHSKEALERLNKMKSVTAPPGYVDQTTEFERNFRIFRQQLEKDGYFKRNWLWDSFYVIIILSLCIFGTIISFSYPVFGSILIGLGMQQAGWVAHDYVHGRGIISYYLGRFLGGVINGFSSEWWSKKHNTHHVHPNQHGVDDDIANDPILHLFIPDPKTDVLYRKYQHYYYHFVYSFLYVSWRLQSVMFSWQHKLYKELLVQSIGYFWIFFILKWDVAVMSILIGGWFVAEVVTASHQSEELMDEISYNFVLDQFKTTRDVHFNGNGILNYFLNWFWGGMQFQLIHHIFPTMPKYRYQSLIPLVTKFAKENGVEYKTADATTILKMNYQTMKKFAQ